MRRELEQALKPVTDNFIDGLLRAYGPIREREASLRTEEVNFGLEKEKQNVEQDKFIVHYTKCREALEDKKSEYETKITELNKELSEVQRTKEDIKKIKQQSDDYLKSVKADQIRASELAKVAEQLKDKHSQKLAYLKVEDDKLEAKRLEIKDISDRTRAKERELLVQEQKLTEAKNQLDKLALDLAIKEKRIKFELKKLQLQD